MTYIQDIQKQEFCNKSELVHNHPRNVPKNFQKDILSRRGDIKVLANFRKEVNQQTDIQEIYSYL